MFCILSAAVDLYRHPSPLFVSCEHLDSKVVLFCLVFCSCLFLFSVSFCLVCLLSVVCIGGMRMFIIIPFVMAQVAFYNETF